MSCEAIRERLSDLIDGELAVEEATSVLRHLEACPECSERHEELLSVVEAVRGVPWPEPPENFAEAVTARLKPRPRPYAKLFWMAPVAAAACLLVLASLFPSPRRSERVAGQQEVARSEQPRELGEKSLDAGAKRDAKPPAAEARANDFPGGTRGSAKEGAAPGGEAALGVGGGGSFSGPTGEVPAGPAMPRPTMPAPGDPAPPAPPRSPGRGVDDQAGVSKSREAPAQVELLVRGLEPDLGAGTLLAELHHRRSRSPGSEGEPMSAAEESKREAEPECEERVLTDEGGSPAGLLLCVTDAELRFVRAFLSKRAAEAVERRQRADSEPDEMEPRAKDVPPAHERRTRLRVLFSED
jgi:hypothetical protein